MRSNRKLIPFAFISLMLVQLIAGAFLFVPEKAHAASYEGNFIDRTRIQVGSVIYEDKNPFDGDHGYAYKTSEGCTNDFKISGSDFRAGKSGSSSDLTATLQEETLNNNSCEDSKSGTITIKNRGVRDVLIYKIDDSTMWMPAGVNYHAFNQGDATDAKTFHKTKPSDTEYQVLNGDGSTNNFDDGGARIDNESGGTARVQTNDCYNGWGPDHCQTETKDAADDVPKDKLVIANDGKVSTPNAKVYPNAPKAGGTSGTGGTDGTSDDTNATCEASGFSLNWILCPVFNMFAETTDWLFKNLVSPLLYTSPVSTDPADPSFKAWSAFRVYGNIFLIIAMLVIVFGQTIGGGIIDAYTAKKVMPRILVAAILINLSVYIVGLLVDITNVLGKGIGQLMMAPVADLLHVAPSPGAQLGAVLTAVLALFLGGAGIAGFLGGLLTAGFLGKAAVFILIGIIVPAMLAILAVFATLVIRRGMILALIMVSPVAFALYCLPNTEQYFKKWWNLLFETLLVFPIVVVIFSTASILSATILVANGATSGSGSGTVVAQGLAGLIAFALQIIPLFLIPFAFKFAGGAMGKLYAAVAGGTAKVGGLTKSRKEQAKQDVQRRMLSARDQQYRALGTYASRGGRFGRSARFLQGRVGGYNLEEGITAMRGETQKRMEQLTSTGDDTEVRALTVNKAEADARGGNLNAPDGNGHVRIHNGTRQYKTLGGKWVDESAVDAAHNRWRGDQDAAQYALSYEMRKATTQEQHDYLYQNVGRLGTRGGAAENATTGQMSGIWTGAAFANQNTDREWKHYQYGENGLTMNGVALMQEIDERQGNYQMTQQHADTWTTMSEEVSRARETLGNPLASPEQQAAANEIIQRGARIARSIGQRVPRQNPDGTPMLDAQGNQIYQTAVGGGASGRTKEEMENFYALFEQTAPRHDPATREETLEPDEYRREVGTTGRANPVTGASTRSDTPVPGRSGTPLPGNPEAYDPTPGARSVGNDNPKRQ